MYLAVQSRWICKTMTESVGEVPHYYMWRGELEGKVRGRYHLGTLLYSYRLGMLKN